MKAFAIAVIAGVAAGLLGALCGVGGGIVMVPVFTGLLGLEHKAAVATSLVVIVVTAVIASSNNAIKGDLIDWRIVAFTAVGASVAAWFGSDLMKSLSSPQLTKIFGVTLILFGIVMLVKK